MDPLLLGTGAAALYFLFKGSKKKRGSKKTTPRTSDVDPTGPFRPTTSTDPTGGFDPFDTPPTNTPRPTDTGDDPAGPGDDPAPIPVPNDIDPSQLDPLELAISEDCQDIYEGSDWYATLFLPSAQSLVALAPDTFIHPWVIMRSLLTFADPDDCFVIDGETDCVLQPECIANWTLFIGIDRDVPGGAWDSSTDAGYNAYLEYSDWYEANYASVHQFLSDLEGRLWMEPDLAAHFESHIDTDIVFLPPVLTEPEAA